MLIYCDENHEYQGISNLTDFGITYPTAISAVKYLAKKRYITRQESGEGLDARMVLRQDFWPFSDHLKSSPNQLMLFAEEAARPQTWYGKKEVDAIIGYYAKEQGVTDEKIKAWFKANYVRNIKATESLLGYCGTLEKGKAAIHRCRVQRGKEKLDWSLAGDVVRNISKWNIEVRTEGGQKKWD
jgi:hypothetical protein